MLGRLGTLLLCAVLAGVVVAGMIFPFLALSGTALRTGTQKFDALPAELTVRRPPQASEVYAADGTTLLARFFDDNRRDIPLADMGEPIQWAIIAAEDQNFYRHNGVDVRGVARAAVANRAGAPLQGASTITMQFVRMSSTYTQEDPTAVVAATEDTGIRKVREARLARAIERKLNKQQILEGYLNMAPFGNGTYGVHTASQLYFGKRPAELTIAEAASLAAIVKSPSYYDPLVPEGARHLRERRDWVIRQMVETKWISRAQGDLESAAPVQVTGRRLPDNCTAAVPNHFGFFCDWFYRWWLAQDGFGATPYDRERRLKSGGYRIVTTLDPGIQNAAQKRVEEHLPTGRSEALMIAAVEPLTGRVRALATNRRFEVPDEAHPNGPSTDPRAGGRSGTYPATTNPLLTGGDGVPGFQAGSTFKMFTLVAALEQGIPLANVINAKERYESAYRGARGDAACPGTDRWCPTNDSDGMTGPQTAWSAFGRSVNTYFVPLEERVGAAKVIDVARRLGIEFRAQDDRARADDPAQANAWGAFTLGVSATTPLDLASAYAALAADGRYCAPVPVQEITGPDGAVPFAALNCREAVSADVARAAIDAARCPVGDRSAFDQCDGATARDARKVVGAPIAGKTGTTDDGRSAALVVTTRELAVAGILADPDRPQGGPAMDHAVVNPAVYETLADAVRGRQPLEFPKPGEKLVFGERKPVPDVTCQPVEAATAALKTAGFAVEQEPVPVPSPCPAGSVASTTPAGKAVAGGVVVLRISRGPAPSTTFGPSSSPSSGPD
ncbi:carboxypeptidase [Virgisporangium aliadipatigenens]|uniref:Carboxypeptidase n=1 Tax=Virgisporangium aliadipatigenens TaxID=741659 RepID=A0A8J4DUD3_9ACTN|nr:carboxypeptidase [Virgisporangium aliadipatigenens]